MNSDSDKQQTALVIGAGAESGYAIQTARGLGLEIVALDGDASAPGLTLSDQSFVIDIRDGDAVCRLLSSHGITPSLVLPVPVGRVLTTTGVVNDRYGLRGVSARAAELVTDKYEFAHRLQAEGLRDADIALIPAGSTSLPTGLSGRYPLIVKPRYGSGSRMVRRCESPAEVTDALWGSDQSSPEAPLSEDFIAESCMDGQEYGLDGLYMGGSFRLVLLRSKHQTPPPYCQCTGYDAVVPGASPDDDTFMDAVIRLMSEAGRVLGLYDCPVHADIIRPAAHDQEGGASCQPFLIELSARPSGHRLHDLFTPMATGYDYIREYIRYASSAAGAQLPPEAAAVRPLHIRYHDLPEGVLSHIPSQDEVLQIPGLIYYECHMEPGERIAPVHEGHDLMGRGCYIIESADLDEVESTVRAVRKKFIVERKA